MKALQLHPWNVTPAEARDIQLRLRDAVELDDRLPAIRTVAGIVVYRFPDMEEIERVSAIAPLTFPYVPGLLSFREIPALLAVAEQLHHAPDLIFCDAQGYAHPRRFGLACHLGLLLDRPTIGVAKSVLIGEHRRLGLPTGSMAPLVDVDSGETIGMAARTVNSVKPVYVSQGHRISLSRAVALTLAVADGHRVPRPTRDADRFVNSIRRERKERSGEAIRLQTSR